MTSLADLTATTPGLPCRTTPDAWFSTDPTERSYAARQCHGCPLLLDCMRYALATEQQHGVWGGVDFEARAMGCGTERGYQIHVRRREPVCAACQAAHDEAVEADRRRRLAEAHAAGGTVRGYWMHRRLEEDACVPCKRALARKSQERRDRERAAAGASVAALRGPSAADAGNGAPAGAHGFALAG